MFIVELFKKIKFCRTVDRIGPDILFTHWRLHFKSSMKRLCRQKFLRFDDTAEVRPGAFVDYCSSVKIGKNVVIRPNTMLFANKTTIIDIQDHVMIASGVHIYTDNHQFSRTDIPILEQEHYQYMDVIIKSGAWIGANAIILTGVTVGLNSVVGAGSVVTKDIPDYSVAVGNPAKVIRSLRANF